MKFLPQTIIALVEWMVYNAPSGGIGVHCAAPEISKKVGFARSILKLELCLCRLKDYSEDCHIWISAKYIRRRNIR